MRRQPGRTVDTPHRLPCPAGCHRRRYPGQMLCTPCWSTLPIDIQQEISHSWRHVQTSAEPSAFLAYQSARNAALAWLSRPSKNVDSASRGS